MIWNFVASFVVSLIVSVWAAARQKTPNIGDRGGLEVNRFGTDEAIPVVYGKREVNPVVVYQGVKDEVDSDTKNETYYAILVWCIGEVDSIEKLYFDDLPHTDFGNFIGDGQRVEHLMGTDDQTMPAWFQQDAPDSMAGMDFNGLCVSFIKLRMDRQFKRYPQGRPEFKALIHGRKVENLETGDIEVSSNPVYNSVDYLTNTRFGMSIDGWDLDVPALIDSARICDKATDDTPSQFTMNMIVDTDERMMNNIKDMMASCRGSLVEGENGLRIEIDRQKDPAMHISTNDLASEISASRVNVNERYNQVIVKYADANDRYTTQEAAFPVSDSTLHQQWLADDNEVPNVHEEEFQAITSYEEAMQMAEVLARQSRYGETVTVTVKSRVGFQLEQMDLITLESQTRGWTQRPFTVREITYGESGTKLTLVEYNENDYAWTPKPVKEYPKTTLPNPNFVGVPTGLTLTEQPDNPSFWASLGWTSPAGYVTGYDVELWNGAQKVFAYQTATEQFWVQGVTSGQWTFKVRAIGSVAVSDWATLDIDVEAPLAPTSVTVETGNTYVILRPQTSQTVFGLTYEYYFKGEQSNGEPELRATGGTSYQMSGLQPDTTYWFEVRTVTSLGQSEGGLSVAGKTTNDNSLILDQLEGAIGQEQLDKNTKDTLDQFDRDISQGKENVNDINLELNNRAKDSEDLWQEIGGLAGDYSSFRNEYERRMYEGEVLTGLVVYKDEETGQIVNLAYNYTDETYTEAGLRIDGVEGQVAIEAQRITDLSDETGESFKKTEASVQVNADAIKLRATYEEVDSAVAGAIEALTPAYSWQFNTTSDGWSGVTHNAAGHIEVAAGVPAVVSGISFDADENTAVRWRARGKITGQATLSWNGGDQQLALAQLSMDDEWESGGITLTPADGWTGTITSIEIDSDTDADIDFVEIGKPSAQQVQLDDLSYRTAVVEQELDPENARWAQYVTTAYWDANALTTTDVQQEISGWDATWGVSATMTQLNDNDTVTKANSAQSWVDGANSNITNVVVAYNAQEGGIDDQLAKAQTDISTAQSEIDALEGTITDTITSFTGDSAVIIDDLEASDFESMMLAYQEFLSSDNSQKEGVKLAFAENKLIAVTDEQSSMAAQILNLQAATNSNLAAIQESNRAFADEKSARAISEKALKAEIKDGDTSAVSEANEYTRAAVGYCLDADGNITGEEDAVVCVAAGNTWIDGVLAEQIRNLQVTTATGSKASIGQIAQVFEDDNGELMARGGITSDVNGKVTGFVSTNDGSKSVFDIIADHFRVGVTDENGSFVPHVYMDNAKGQMVYRGQMVLGDGFEVKGEADIRAHDGYTPVKGVDYFDGDDGYTPQKGVDYDDGADGYTPQKDVDYFDGDKGDKGDTPVKGVDYFDGQDGSAGAGFYSLAMRDGVFPDSATATSDFTAAFGRAPVLGDHLTYHDVDLGTSSVKRFDGAGWVAPQLIIHGDMLARGTVTGDRLVANTEITAPVIKGGKGDFSGSLTVDGESWLKERVNIGNQDDYDFWLEGDGTSSTNWMIGCKRKSDGSTRFYIRADGHIYSAAGGDLHNLTIHDSCTINGTLNANQVRGDFYAKRTYTTSSKYGGNGNTSWHEIERFYVRDQTPFERTLNVDGITCGARNYRSGYNATTFYLRIRNLSTGATLYSGSIGTSTVDTNGYVYATFAPSCTVPNYGDSTSDHTYVIEFRSSSGNFDPFHTSQKAVIELYKKSSVLG